MAIKGLSVIAGLKMLANTVRGLKVEHAHILYKGCVVPILTYGSPIWYREHGCKTLIKPLEKAQNAGLRWLLGAFRTSPVHAMEHVASIPPIHVHLGKLNQNAGTRLQRLPIRSEVARCLPTEWDTHDPSVPHPQQAKHSTPITHLASLSHPAAEHSDP
jgi:hypothetical protein